MEYTKGEWEVKGYPSGRYIQTNDKIIAQIWGQKPQAETEANAHLIASAPDLYEACKIALGLLICYDIKAAREVADIIRQALAKAEGK